MICFRRGFYREKLRKRPFNPHTSSVMDFSVAKGTVNKFLLTQYHPTCNILTSVMKLPSPCLVQDPVSFWLCEGRPGDAGIECTYNTWGTFQQSQASTVPSLATGWIFCSATSASWVMGTSDLVPCVTCPIHRVVWRDGPNFKGIVISNWVPLFETPGISDN